MADLELERELDLELESILKQTEDSIFSNVERITRAVGNVTIEDEEIDQDNKEEENVKNVDMGEVYMESGLIQGENESNGVQLMSMGQSPFVQTNEDGGTNV